MVAVAVAVANDWVLSCKYSQMGRRRDAWCAKFCASTQDDTAANIRASKCQYGDPAPGNDTGASGAASDVSPIQTERENINASSGLTKSAHQVFQSFQTHAGMPEQSRRSFFFQFMALLSFQRMLVAKAQFVSSWARCDLDVYGSPGPLILICGIGGGGLPFVLSRARRHFRIGIRLSPWGIYALVAVDGTVGTKFQVGQV